jgi:hypothetical protein
MNWINVSQIYQINTDENVSKRKKIKNEQYMQGRIQQLSV